MLRILFYGDIVGKPGRQAVRMHLENERSAILPDIVIANGENASGGLGIEAANADEIFGYGVDVITSGNHIWQKKGIDRYLDNNCARFIRPANFPPGAPGKGSCTFTTKSGANIFIINLIGRVFMPQQVDCPFRALDEILKSDDAQAADFILVDFHAETTSEKAAFAFYADGRVGAVIGTHTHVQTADARLLPKGTAFISDVGMCGVAESVLGFANDEIIKRFLSSRPTRMEVAKGAQMINACIITVDEETKRAKSIERLFVRL